MVAHLGAAPSISSSQARRVAVSLARDCNVDAEIGGLCGHCSHDLPLDRRLLFVAELTGHEMVGCVGNAPTLVRLDIRFTGGSRSLRGYQPEDGCGTWSRTTIEKLMRLLWFSTFPRFEMVDRHGFAPCSPACKAGNLLNDRAARELGGGGGNRTRS